MDEREWDEIILNWGANVIRLPFNQEWALASPGYNPERYLMAIDWAIENSARRGAYTILDLQWLDASTGRGVTDTGENNFVPSLPNRASLEVWAILAGRYRDEPAVLYDIFNEPHDQLPGDDTELLGIDADGSLFALPGRRVSIAEWQPWAVRLVGIIRQQHPQALILVPGVDWAFDLRGHPLPDMQGVVYSTHVYPSKNSDWDAAFGTLADTAPVFVGEWGGRADDREWGQRLLNYMDARDLSWTAWSWSDRPYLVQSPSAYRPTPFGKLVYDALRFHNRQHEPEPGKV